MKRCDPEYRNKEKEQLKLSRERKIVENFHKNVLQGPNHVCSVCDQLWYRNNVVPMTAVRFKTNTLKETCTSGIKCADGIEYICTTCRTYLEKNKIPPLAKANGVIFPVKPRTGRKISGCKNTFHAATRIAKRRPNESTWKYCQRSDNHS